MNLTWPSSKCKRTIVWRSSRGSGGMVANAQRRRTTEPKVCLFTSALVWLVFQSSHSRFFHPVVPRSGHGEHRRYLRGAGVRPAGGYLHGSAGVCLDVKADTRKWGERGLSDLHLLCLPLPSLVPSPSQRCEASQLPALTESATGVFFFLPRVPADTQPPSIRPMRHNQHKAKDIPHLCLTHGTCVHGLVSFYSTRSCIDMNITLNIEHYIVYSCSWILLVNTCLQGAFNKILLIK